MPTEYQLLLLALVASNVATALLWLRARGPVLSKLPSFDEYRAKHPAPSAEQGPIRCWNCGSTSIDMRWRAFNRGINLHTCRHCGTPLYRS